MDATLCGLGNLPSLIILETDPRFFAAGRIES